MCITSRIVDGDTITAYCQYRGDITIRLLDVNTFEVKRYKQAFKEARECKLPIAVILQLGEKEKDYTQKLLSGRGFVLVLKDRRYDVYGRILGEIYTFDNGIWININQLIKKNHQKIVSKYCIQ